MLTQVPASAGPITLTSFISIYLRKSAATHFTIMAPNLLFPLR